MPWWMEGTIAGVAVASAWLLLVRLVPRRHRTPARFLLERSESPDRLLEMMWQAAPLAWAVGSGPVHVEHAGRVGTFEIEVRRHEYPAHQMVERAMVDRRARSIIAVADGPHARIEAVVRVRALADGRSELEYMSGRWSRPWLGAIDADDLRDGMDRVLDRVALAPGDEQLARELDQRQRRAGASAALVRGMSALWVTWLVVGADRAIAIAWPVAMLVDHLVRGLGDRRRLRQALAQRDEAITVSLRTPSTT